MNRKKKIGLIIAACMLICVGGIFFGFHNKTLALFTDSAYAVNVIKTGKLTITTEEKVSGGIKTDIGVTNTGDVDVYVRMMVLIPADSDYLVFHSQLVEDYTNFWIHDEKDNYWYYKGKLPHDESVTLYKSITVEKPVDTSGTEELKQLVEKYGDVIVYAEALQADNIVIPDDKKDNPAKAAFEQLKKQ